MVGIADGYDGGCIALLSIGMESGVWDKLCGMHLRTWSVTQ